jgi:lipopolysaccharide biosynthesis protein
MLGRLLAHVFGSSAPPSIDGDGDILKLVRDSEYMDVDYYLETNPDVRLARVDPVEHFLVHGWKEGRSPSAAFSVQDYLLANPDIAGAGINPLVHYLQRGRNENRRLAIPSYEEYLCKTTVFYTDEASGFSASSLLGSRSLVVSHAQEKLAVIIHIFYEELAQEMLEYVKNIFAACDVFITISDKKKKKPIEAVFSQYEKGSVHIKVIPNRGRDIAPFLLAFPNLFDEYDYVCKIHAKKSLHSDGAYANAWRQYLLQSLLGSPQIVDNVLNIFRADANVGLVYPPANRAVYPYVNWIGYESASVSLLSKIGIDKKSDEFKDIDFPAGTMFWVRPQAIKALVEYFQSKGYESFPAEPLPKDFTLNHVLERIVPVVCESAGYKVICAGVRSLTQDMTYSESPTFPLQQQTVSGRRQGSPIA